MAFLAATKLIDSKRTVALGQHKEGTYRLKARKVEDPLTGNIPDS